MIFALTTLFITKLNLLERAGGLAAKAVVVILGLVLLLVTIFVARSCYVNYKIEQTQNEINEIRQEQVNTTANISVATIEAKDADNRVIEARREAERAKETLEKVQRADS